jgi:thioredoxin-like negative regulator of GroEL
MIFFCVCRWCGHCKALSPVWTDLATDVEDTTGVAVASVNCDDEADLCGDWNIEGYPTLLLFHDGKHVDSYDGGRELETLIFYLRVSLPPAAFRPLHAPSRTPPHSTV